MPKRTCTRTPLPQCSAVRPWRLSTQAQTPSASASAKTQKRKNASERAHLLLPEGPLRAARPLLTPFLHLSRRHQHLRQPARVAGAAAVHCSRRWRPQLRNTVHDHTRPAAPPGPGCAAAASSRGSNPCCGGRCSPRVVFKAGANLGARSRRPCGRRGSASAPVRPLPVAAVAIFGIGAAPLLVIVNIVIVICILL